MTRRDFLSTTAATGLVPGGRPVPWYGRTSRWGQTYLTEKDPESYDIAYGPVSGTIQRKGFLV